ncbi:acyl-CoA N-acyltransferase [Amanita rubescens]|nr:acyl-CoA N-acyltransferase [Amanita rubescens]
MAPDEFEVRPLTSADLPRVRQLHSTVLPVNYPSAFFLQLLLLPARLCLVAHPRADPHNPVAFVSAALSNAPTPRIEILTLGVLPSFQHKGLARRLISSIINSLSPDSTLVQANVAASNASALKFYERLGLRISSDIITNLYRTCSHGSKDGYLVAGCINSDYLYS